MFRSPYMSRWTAVTGRFDRFFRSRSKGALLAWTLALLLAIGYIDLVTDAEVTLSAAYAGPILITAWYGTRLQAVMMALLSTLVWWGANASIMPFHTALGVPLILLNRMAYYVFFAVGGSAIKAHQESARSRVEALERTRELEREILRVSEFEQQRIGQDLHDGLCQYLAAISCAAAALADDLQNRHQPEAGQAEEIQRLISQAVIQARDLARGIFPVQMDGAGLGAALQELASTTDRLTSMSVTWSEVGETRIKDPSTAMQFYRIAQEALSNALRHGKAKRAAVSLQQKENIIQLTVEDDGKGFSPDTQALNGGMGLRTMRYRAQVLNAELQIGPSSLGGSAVCCTARMGAAPLSFHP